MTLTRDDLYSLEDYAANRADFRKRVREHKETRRVPVGAHVTLHFEDRLTMQYQIQEMLRAERIFDAEGIEVELEAYNALIPSGSNWKATMMVEYENVEERREALARLRGIENAVWVRIGERYKVRAIADEDLERQNESKTSAVHFLRFELTPEMVTAAKAGAGITVGIEHEDYGYQNDLSPAIRDALTNDLH
jgi:hypothetical protein